MLILLGSCFVTSKYCDSFLLLSFFDSTRRGLHPWYVRLTLVLLTVNFT